MQYSDLSLFADVCQVVTVLLSMAAYLPQWSVILKRRSSEHVALWAWILWLGSSTLSLIYALVLNYIEGIGAALLLTTSINFCFLIVTIGLIMRFRRPNNRGSKEEAASPGILDTLEDNSLPAGL